MSERYNNFLSRLKAAAPVSALLFGVFFGALDAISVINAASYLFAGLFDQIIFVLFCVSFYALVGLLLGLAAALVPLALFPVGKNLDGGQLGGFYLVLVSGVLAALVALVENVAFTTLSQEPVRNLLVIAAIAAGAYFLISFLAKFIVRVRPLCNGLRQVSDVLLNKLVLGVILVILIATGFQVVGTAGNKIEGQTGPPNILLISFDTLGSGHVGAYGYDKPTTPNIDRFAKEGTLFENHFTVSRITLPSHMTMFTSVYPSVHRVIDSFASVLDQQFVTLAEILQESGYETGAFVDGNRELNIGAAHGFDQGFEFYQHYPERFLKHEKLYLIKRLLNFVENSLHRRGTPDMHSANLFDSAMSWLIGRRPDKPFFLFLHTYDIHSDFGTRLPYVSPDGYEEIIPTAYRGDFDGCGSDGACATKHLVNINKKVRRGRDPAEFLSSEEADHIATLYDRGIRYTDDQFGRFFDSLRQANILDNTIVMLTSDHGEEFYQHNQMKHVQYYDEVLQVPLVVRYPGRFQAGTRVQALSRSVDLLPTLLDAAGIDFQSEQFQGVSLLPYTTGNDTLPELTLFAGQDHPSMDAETRIARTLQHKYIRNGSDRKHYHFNLERPEELYDIVADPHETTNIVQDAKATHEALSGSMDKWNTECLDLLGQMAPTGLTKKIKIDGKSAEALKSLGYVK